MIPPALLTIAQDFLYSGVAALGFAMLFNVPVRTLFSCALVGAAGYTLRAGFMLGGMGIELATLCGAALVGLLGEYFARRWFTPTTVFTISGAIMLVPGKFAFETMLGLINLAAAGNQATAAMLMDASVDGIKTALILTALTLGIAAPKLLFQRNRPVV